MNKFFKFKYLVWGIGALQAFIGFTAIVGGSQLVAHPQGTPAMPIEMLQSSPFASFFIPGIVLLVFIGAVNVLTLVVTVKGSRHSGSMAAIGGGILIAYMTAEVWWIGLQNALQPLYFALGVALVLSGLVLRRMQFGRTPFTSMPKAEPSQVRTAA